jgi:Uma2 family endonuclease
MMASPFPGIDPYLESHHLWEGFHARFVPYFCDALNDVLPENYVAELGAHFHLMELTGREAKQVLPDVAVVEGDWKSARGAHRRARSAGALALEPVTIPLPRVRKEVRDVWIEIRRPPKRAPIAIIEVLSPTNKSSDGFVEYKLKRTSTIRQKVHLVEFDFLLGGRRLSMGKPLPAGDYFALISRAERRPDSEVYAWTVRDRLPSIPIPLAPPDDDVVVDLGAVFTTAYSRGRYARLIDYTTPPSVLRKPEDRTWAEKIARRARR